MIKAKEDKRKKKRKSPEILTFTPSCIRKATTSSNPLADARCCRKQNLSSGR